MKEYVFNTTEICNRCKGEGVIVIPGNHIGHGKYTDPVDEVCSLCDGWGIVNIRKDIKVTITPKKPKTYAR